MMNNPPVSRIAVRLEVEMDTWLFLEVQCTTPYEKKKAMQHRVDIFLSGNLSTIPGLLVGLS